MLDERPSRQISSHVLSLDPRFTKHPKTAMLVELLALDSLIEADHGGLSMISDACAALSKSSVTVDKVWPGKIYDLSS